jgi:putative transposase
MARRKPPVIADQLLDQLLAGADAKTVFEKDGLLDELKKALAERALNAEIDHHLETGEAGQQPQWVWQENGADRHRQDRA